MFLYRFVRRRHRRRPQKMFMMTSSNGNFFRVTGHLCGEFTGPGEFPTQRPVTRSFDVLFDLRLNKRLSKQSWGWWFETLSCSLWRHCNVTRWIRTTFWISFFSDRINGPDLQIARLDSDQFSSWPWPLLFKVKSGICYIQPKTPRLPRNEKRTYRLNPRPQMWPSSLTLAVTWSLNLLGQIWNLLYISDKNGSIATKWKAAISIGL